MTNTVKIERADKYYNKGRQNQLHVIDNVSLELPEAGMVAVFGKSGCGKTTLLNVIGGLDRMNSGKIEIFGNDLKKSTDYLRNKYIGYIFQNYNLNVNETVFENVADALRLCGVTDENEINERVISALTNVDMEKYRLRTPNTLSGGQQQRVAIARAIVKGPAIILADEPTGNLDENNTVTVMDILKELSRSCLVILVTHEAELVDFYCDKVIEVVDGRIVNEYDNENADGYVQKNKNHVYLGELERHELGAGNVNIDYYGDALPQITLRIVNHGGKLYLESKTPGLKVVDGTSEIRFMDGKFEDTVKSSQNGKNLDLSKLSTVCGEKFGALFHFGNSVKLAWREYYSQKKKKGKKFLRVCMFLLAAVLVFMSARLGVSIRDYFDIKEDSRGNTLYLYADPEKDYTPLYDSIGKNGIEYARLTYNGEGFTETDISFLGHKFMTANMISLEATGNQVSSDVLSDMKLLCGTKEIKDGTEFVISSALADKIIESSTVSYINEYEDLLGLVTEWVGNRNETAYKIVGVVQAGERNFYMTPLECAKTVLTNDMYISAIPYSSVPAGYSDTKPEAGEAVIYVQSYLTPPEINSEILILGQKFTVKNVVIIDEKSTEYYIGDMMTQDEMRLMYNSSTVILSDSDYIALSYSMGKTDDIIEGNRPSKGESTYTGDVDYTHRITVHSSDPDATEKFLSEKFSALLVTPDEIFEANVDEHRDEIVRSVISVLVVVGLICLCVFFIMRSSFMSRVREVGIMRAIGVTKKNLVFRFAVETLLLVLLTSVIGFLVSSFVIRSLAGSALFGTMFYYPVWMAALLFAVLCAVCVFFGVLPAILLLTKTPSEILSKYDI